MERLTPKLWISCAQRPNVSETSNMKDMGQHVDEKQKESYVSPHVSSTCSETSHRSQKKAGRHPDKISHDDKLPTDLWYWKNNDLFRRVTRKKNGYETINHETVSNSSDHNTRGNV